MKTSNSSIFEALSLNNTSFFIPPYQRAYSWGREQINRFFDDVMRLVHSEQDPMQKDKQQHFFGTLVYKWEGQGSFAKRQVIIDGQQRLTTTLIFCIALRDLSTDQEEKQNITNTLLINEKSTFKDKIKLKQVTSDWDAYGALVMGKESVPGKITDAYNLFIRLLRKQLENEGITAEHFITALQRINVAISCQKSHTKEKTHRLSLRRSIRSASPSPCRTLSATTSYSGCLVISKQQSTMGYGSPR